MKRIVRQRKAEISKEKFKKNALPNFVEDKLTTLKIYHLKIIIKNNLLFNYNFGP